MNTDERFYVSGMTCASCVSHVEKAAKSVNGVNNVSVNLMTGIMSIEMDKDTDVNDICKAVKDAGYFAESIGEQVYKSDNNDKKILIKLILSVLILIPLMYFSMGHNMFGWNIGSFLSENLIFASLLQMILTLIILVINRRFFISGFKSLIKLSPNMDTLIMIGSGTSFIYSTFCIFKMFSSCNECSILQDIYENLYFDSSAMILVFISIGKYLENNNKKKATESIRGLMNVLPDMANVIRDENEVKIPVSSAVKGDVFVVYPGEKIPLDGAIVKGNANIDESSLTGESIPSEKNVGDKVFASSINCNGTITCIATENSQNSEFSRIISATNKLISSKPEISRIADKVASYFVPVVIVISFVTFLIWKLLGYDIGFSLERAISVLVISCPCALGLATPVAIVVGSGISAKRGILFKNAEIMEAVGKSEIIVFDKTGTITCGKPAVTDVIVTKNTDEKLFMEMAFSVERMSKHPLAEAVCSYAKSNNVLYHEIEKFNDIAGCGITAEYNGKKICAGNLKLMAKYGITVDVNILNDFLSEGKTIIYFAVDDEFFGLIALSDKPRAESDEVVSTLKSMGKAVYLLSGDNLESVKKIAENVGIENYYYGLLPLEKAEIIKVLSSYGKTLMVGDGINDTPSLAAANVGVAVKNGSDIAIDSADVVMLKSGISALPEIINISRFVISNIKYSLFWALFYNSISIPIAAGILIPICGISLNPMIASIAMSLSSLCVMTNALSLNLRDTTKYIKSDKNITLPSAEYIMKTIEERRVKSMKKTITIEGMMCMHCVAHVEKALKAIEGIEEVQVSLDNKNAVVTFNENISDDVIRKAIEDGGYNVISIE